MAEAIFVLTAIGMAAALALGAYASGSRVAGHLAVAVTAAWLAGTGIAATQGFFRVFDARPPHLFFAVGPAFAIMLAAVTLPATGRLLDRVPQSWLIGAQVFRVPVEIGLWLLYREGRLAELLTWHGRNFDVLVGITAPIVAWYLAKRGSAPALTRVWNLFGLALVTNVATHGILSAPTPFRTIYTDPPNAVMGEFPFIWLPAFLVPCAFLLHFLSLRKLHR